MMPFTSVMLCTYTMGNEAVAKYDAIISKIWMVLTPEQFQILTVLFREMDLFTMTCGGPSS